MIKKHFWSLLCMYLSIKVHSFLCVKKVFFLYKNKDKVKINQNVNTIRKSKELFIFKMLSNVFEAKVEKSNLVILRKFHCFNGIISRFFFFKKN